MIWLKMNNPVARWWLFMVLASGVNIAAWIWAVARFNGHSRAASLRATERSMLTLSGVYVSVCAFRAVLPRADVQRFCLFDTWFSSVLVGRSVATVAELCFVAQWAIAIRFLAEQTGAAAPRAISGFLLPIIFLAECCSWFAVITTDYLGNAVEESLWTLTYALVLVALISVIPKLCGRLKTILLLACAGVTLYILFMVKVDVPMYYWRWRTDVTQGKTLFDLSGGLHDLNTRWVVTHDWRDWRTEAPWMSFYFSLAVLGSIGLCYVPQPPERFSKWLKSMSSPSSIIS